MGELMRTTKRFTPAVLARFDREGRGQGVFQDYQAWHQVSRGDPASRGRSHLNCVGGRLVHLLSDKEWDCHHFCLQLHDLVDLREQLPLSLETSQHPLRAYTLRAPQGTFAGTLELADELKIKHPKLVQGGVARHWVPTTDQLLVRKKPDGMLWLQAVSVKPLGWEARSRDIQLLNLEKEYWNRRGVDWLLITPAQWDRRVTMTLRRIACWALTDAVDPELSKQVVEFVQSKCTVSALETTEYLWRLAGDIEIAKRTLWQSVWQGRLPIDLRRGWRPQEPLRMLPHETFWQQNPVASGRSAWI